MRSMTMLRLLLRLFTWSRTPQDRATDHAAGIQLPAWLDQ